MPAFAHQLDFEVDLAGFSSLTGGPTRTTSFFKNGIAGFLVAPTGGQQFGTINLDTSKSVLVGRFEFQPRSTTGGGAVHLLRVASGNGNRVYFRFEADNKLRVFGHTGSSEAGAQVSASALTLNTWYRVDFRVDMSANPWITKWQIEGSAQTDVSSSLSSGTLSSAALGNVDSAATVTFVYDDVGLGHVAAEYPYGAAGGGGALTPTPFPGLALPAQDNFNAADGALGSPNWTNAGAADIDGGLERVSGQVRSLVALDGGARWNTTYGPNAVAGVTLATLGGADQEVEVQLLLGSSPFDGYQARYEPKTGDDEISLRRLDDGVEALIASGLLTFGGADGLALEVRDANVTLWRRLGITGQWVVALAKADAIHRGQFAPALAIENTTWRLDDFFAGSLNPAPPGVPEVSWANGRRGAVRL